MPALSPEDHKRGYIVFLRHWMDLVFPNSIPKEAELIDELSISACRGEYEPVSFCIRTLKELKNWRVRATGLIREDGFRLRAPEVRIVRAAPKPLKWNHGLYKDGVSQIR